jgi:aspartyl protease family protein
MRLLWPLAAVFLLIALLMHFFPDALHSDQDKAETLRLTIWLAVIGSSLALRFNRRNMPHMLKAAGAWALIFLVLLLIYSYREPLLHSRLVAELLPSRVQMNENGSLSVRARENGHFFLTADVNGEPVEFMIDTGASGIVLTPHDAKRAGIDMDALRYTMPSMTANGIGMGAPVEIKTLRVGDVTLRNVPASVNQAEMDNSLLGMTFLKRFRSYSVEGDTLTLVP